MVCAYVALFADPPPRRDHDVRRPRSPATSSRPTLPEGLEPTPAGAARRAAPRGPGGRRRSGASTPRAAARSCGGATDRYVALVTDAARRRRHQLPDRVTAGPRAWRRSRPRRRGPRTAARSTPTRCTDITDQVGVRVITYLHSDVAAVADLLGDQLAVLDDRDMGQETAQPGPVRLRQPAPAGRARRRPRGPAAYELLRGRARRCRSARCCSTRGRSSSTRSATRARSPRSTCPTSTAGSPWPPACSSSPTASSRRSATGCRRRLPGARRPRDAGDDPRISAQELADLPRRAVPRRRLVAHRPLRLDLRAAAGAGHHLARRAGRPADRPSTATAINAHDGLPLPARRRTPPRRRAARRLTASATSTLHGNGHRVPLLRPGWNGCGPLGLPRSSPSRWRLAPTRRQSGSFAADVPVADGGPGRSWRSVGAGGGPGAGLPEEGT